jgi:hypothetical protein
MKTSILDILKAKNINDYYAVTHALATAVRRR